MAGRGQGIPVARGRARPVPIRSEHVMTRSMARARANINNVEDSIAANDPDLEVLTGANGSDPRSSEESGSESAFENVDSGQPAGLTSTPSSPTITRQPDDYVSRRDFEVLQRRIDSLVDYLHTNNRTPRVRRRLPQTPDVSSRISPRQNVVDSGVVAGNQDGRCQQDQLEFLASTINKMSSIWETLPGTFIVLTVIVGLRHLYVQLVGLQANVLQPASIQKYTCTKTDQYQDRKMFGHPWPWLLWLKGNLSPAGWLPCLPCLGRIYGRRCEGWFRQKCQLPHVGGLLYPYCLAWRVHGRPCQWWRQPQCQQLPLTEWLMCQCRRRSIL